MRLAAVLFFLLLARVATAQPPPDGAADARLKLGPLSLDPRLTIRNVGVDTNVFNDAEAPVRDFTATVGPEVDSWIRVGRLDWAGTSTVVWNYFRESTNQRSFDLGQSGRLGLALGRVMPFARGAIERSRQRPNLEIDARVRRETTDLAGGLELLIGARSRLALEHGQRELRFDDATLAGESLARALDRRETTSAVRAQLVLTPLTTMVIAAEARRDRFRYSIDRSSDSAKVTGGLVLRPLALVSGRALVGARRFEPKSPLVPAFTGMVADVELAYQVRDLTRFVGLVQRDVDYSFEPSQAYYVSTGLRLSVVQAIGGGWDVVAHAARTDLAYRARSDSDPERDRRDRVHGYGLGVGRRFGTEVRLGLDLEYVTRSSSVRRRTYEGLRGGGSFSYGF
ncbi:MAG: outer membrane beta-barrel protein [Acidobacteria bacterium]|nr:outer membrane beta-barrel protein [Acidobacteriota bacterium]